MHIQVEKFLAWTAKLAGFVPAGGPAAERPAGATDVGPRQGDREPQAQGRGQAGRRA